MQKHVIKRQIIELSVPDRDTAQRLQADVSRICQRLVPLIDQICTELSSPDRIHRIERLAIDLGTIHTQQLEHELVDRVHQAIYSALKEEIDQQERKRPSTSQNPKTQSQLELLTLFLRTGSLPWWVDASEANLLDDALTFLMDAAPGALRRLIADMNRSDTYLRRLAQAFDDEQLARLTLVLAGKPGDISAGDLVALSHSLIQTKRIPSHLLRQQLWLTVLHFARQTRGFAPQLASFCQIVLTQLAVHFGIAYTTLLADLDQVVQPTTAQTPLGIAIHDLSLNQLPEEGHLDRISELVSAILAYQQPAPEHDERDRRATLTPDEAFERLLAWVNALMEHDQLSPEQRVWLTKAAELDRDDVTPDMLSRIEAIVQDAEAVPEAMVPDLSFSEADEIYVHNAGLVILWPFLTRFFGNLNLLTERQFTDEAAQHRAAGILQYLVYPQDAFPEYLLPLNKVLCGLDLAAVFRFDAPLTDEEREQCEAFLEAVIAQAPILNNMSTDGFRGTFLLRKGVLSLRHGIWLLRVERGTYDVVLDRFPWSWLWIKLPWMETALQVEWQL